MTAATSRVLLDVRRAVLAGAPVVVSGVVDDAVLHDGEVVTLRAGLRRILEGAGFGTVVWVDAADGISGADAAHTSRLRALPAMSTARPWPGTVRSLLTCEEHPLAVVVEGAGLLFGEVPHGPDVAAVTAGAREARAAGAGGLPNALVVLSRVPEDVPVALRELAGVAHLEAPASSEAERHAVLRLLAGGFHGAPEMEPRVLDAALSRLAGATAGRPLVALEHLRRTSLECRIPVGEPGALLRAAAPRRDDDWSRRELAVDGVAAALARDVVGQAPAVHRLAEAVVRARIRSPLRSPTAAGGRPRGWCALTGGSGTGKTELVRALARVLTGSEDHVVRVDCGALKQSHDVAKLTGAPPGYVGYGVEGLLTGPIRRRPSSVVLIDEVDKCDPEVLDVFLALLEEGELASGNSVTSFADAFIVFTSNFGAEDVRRAVASGALAEPADVMAAHAAALREVLRTPPEEGGKGRPALWSRLQGRVIGFDILRRAALPGFVAKADARVGANAREDHGIAARIDRAAFVAELDRRLPDDGEWDGRTVDVELGALIETALDEALVAGLPPGAAVTLRPPARRARHTAELEPVSAP